MKKLLTVIGLLVCISSQSKADMITVKVSTVKEDRQVSGFSGIASNGYVNVVIKLGDTESLRLEGDADAIADLVTEVKGNVLHIRPKTKVYWDNKFKNTKVTAFITAKKITNLTLSGSAEMRVENDLQTSSLSAVVSGSGTIKLKANLQSFNGVISGSGNISVSGKTDTANINISGSGKFIGKTFNIEKLNGNISGSGSMNVQVNDYIKAVISGSGSIYYSGNAKIDKTTVGSGKIRKA